MADTLTITDNRTGKQYEIPIQDGTIRAMDLRQIKVVRRRVRHDDVRPGVHEHGRVPQPDHLHRRRQGHPALSRLSRSSSWPSSSDFLETAYLILFGELPTERELEQWTHDIIQHTMLHENITKLMEGFRYDAHPMGMFISTVGALSTFYPDAKNIFSSESRRLQTHAADRQGADHRGLRVPPLHRPALRLCRTTSSPTPATSSTCCSG